MAALPQGRVHDLIIDENMAAPSDHRAVTATMARDVMKPNCRDAVDKHIGTPLGTEPCVRPATT